MIARYLIRRAARRAFERLGEAIDRHVWLAPLIAILMAMAFNFPT